MRLEEGKVKHPFDGETLYCNQTFTVLKVNESYLEGGKNDLYVCKMHKLDNKKKELMCSLCERRMCNSNIIMAP